MSCVGHQYPYVHTPQKLPKHWPEEQIEHNEEYQHSRNVFSIIKLIEKEKFDTLIRDIMLQLLGLRSILYESGGQEDISLTSEGWKGVLEGSTEEDEDVSPSMRILHNLQEIFNMAQTLEPNIKQLMSFWESQKDDLNEQIGEANLKIRKLSEYNSEYQMIIDKQNHILGDYIPLDSKSGEGTFETDSPTTDQEDINGVKSKFPNQGVFLEILSKLNAFYTSKLELIITGICMSGSLDLSQLDEFKLNIPFHERLFSEIKDNHQRLLHVMKYISSQETYIIQNERTNCFDKTRERETTELIEDLTSELSEAKDLLSKWRSQILHPQAYSVNRENTRTDENILLSTLNTTIQGIDHTLQESRNLSMIHQEKSEANIQNLTDSAPNIRTENMIIINPPEEEASGELESIGLLNTNIKQQISGPFSVASYSAASSNQPSILSETLISPTMTSNHNYQPYYETQIDNLNRENNALNRQVKEMRETINKEKNEINHIMLNNEEKYEKTIRILQEQVRYLSAELNNNSSHHV